MTLTVCAADPGVAPSLAIYAGPDYAPVLCDALGAARLNSSGKKRTDPDVPALLTALEYYQPQVGGIEIVSSRPGEGVASAARFANAAGLMEGIFYGRRMRVVKLAPKTWRSAFRLQPGKDQSRIACTRLFPALTASFARVKDHNISDALLMAVLIWHRETGARLPL